MLTVFRTAIAGKFLRQRKRYVLLLGAIRSTDKYLKGMLRERESKRE